MLAPHRIRQAAMSALAALALTLPAAWAAAANAADTPAKDIVLDAAPVATPPPLHTPAPASRAAGPLTDFGLDLWQALPSSATAKPANTVFSPLSVGAALGMLHAGAGPADAAELARLFGTVRGGRTVLGESLPAALKAATADGGPLRAASRLWVAPAAAKHLQPAFLRQLAERYDASAQGLDFARAEPARGQINTWVAAQTQGLIQDLMPAGSVLPNTRLVLTQALHFRSPWAQPFDPAATTAQRFDVQPGVHKLVPTMHGEVKARAAEVGGWQIVELPFAQGGYVLQLVLPPAGQTLAQARAELDAADVAAWQAQLKPVRCEVELPKLALRSSGVSLKAALQRLGVQKLFSPQADFKPALGSAAAGLQVDEVIHAARFALDESGGEAAAATGASASFKSLDLTPTQACRFDRPFLFTLIHAPTGTPVVMGGVVDPTQP